MRAGFTSVLGLLVASTVFSSSARADDVSSSVFLPSRGRICRPVLGSSKSAGRIPAIVPPLPGCEIGKPAYVCDPAPLRPPIPIPVPVPGPTTNGGGDGTASGTIVPAGGREICYRLRCKGATPLRSSVETPSGPPIAVGPPALYCVASPIVTPPPPPPPPPSDCEEDADCGDGSFCRYPIGACGGPGQCTPRAVLCPLASNASPSILPITPVCGCNGKTFSSACAATHAGVSLLHLDACEGGIACPDIYLPVCGVDGVTYPNACSAGAAGVAVAHDGPCEDAQ